MSISTEIVSTNQNIDIETKEHNDKIELISDIIKFMRKNGYFVGKPGSHKLIKEFLTIRLVGEVKGYDHFHKNLYYGRNRYNDNDYGDTLGFIGQVK